MEELWIAFLVVAVVVLFWRSMTASRRARTLEGELASLRSSLAQDWTARQAASKDLERRLAALEVGGVRVADAGALRVEGPEAVGATDGEAATKAAAALDVTAAATDVTAADVTPAEVTAADVAAGEAVPDSVAATDGDTSSDAPTDTAPTIEATAPPPLTPPTPAASPLPPPKSPRPRVNLEEWLGVKGAAVGGGIIACLAAVLLFQHAIDEGWISPAIRVVMGTLAGILGIGAAQTKKLRQYAITANAMAGAGLVALYASFWAAHVLYDLVPKYPTGALMALVTAACIALSLRHNAILIALLGLAGGLATPLLLSSGSDKPIELFGYLLLLDVAFVYLAQKKDWAVLGGLALLGTLFFQTLWIGTRMGPERLWLGVGILMVFTALFAAASSRVPEEKRGPWDLTTAASMLFPLAFGFYFAARSSLSENAIPILGMVVAVNAGAAWLAHRRSSQRLLPLGVASASLGILAVFVAVDAADHALQLGAGVAVLLAAIHHGLFEVRLRRPMPAPVANADGVVTAAAPKDVRGVTVAALGGALVVLLGQYLHGYASAGWWTGVLAVTALAAMLLRQSSVLGRPGPALGAAFTLAFAVLEGLLESGPRAPIGTILAGLFGLGAALQGWAVAGASPTGKRAAEQAAATFAFIGLLGLAFAPDLGELPALVVGLGFVGLAALVCFAATRIDAGGWLLATTIAVSFAHSTLVSHRGAVEQGVEGPLLAVLAGTVVLMTWWPAMTTKRFRTSRWAWYGAALIGPLSFPASRTLWESLLGDGMTGVLAVLYAAVAVGALAKVTREWASDDPVRTSVLAWLGAAALFFVSLAIPLQLERSWWTIGWALEGLAVLHLYRRVDHPGLKYLALGLFGAVGARLLINPEVLGYYDRGSWRIVNWLAYTYLVPAAALIGGVKALGPIEKERSRPWESWIYATPVSVAGVLGLVAVAVGFAWVNLAVVDWFAEGSTLRVSLDRMPARDLSFSISWALYAVMLLAVGMARRIAGLRYLSLALLVVTIGKVFLYDLGHLEDLYRVASLVGLAVSLFLVSMAYQRFVFGREGGDGDAGGAGLPLEPEAGLGGDAGLPLAVDSGGAEEPGNRETGKPGDLGGGVPGDPEGLGEEALPGDPSGVQEDPEGSGEGASDPPPEARDEEGTP